MGLCSENNPTTMVRYVIIYAEVITIILEMLDISARIVNRNVNPTAAANKDATSGRQTTEITSVALMPKGAPA